MGRTPEGDWRHCSYQAPSPGGGVDPNTQPRVEVLRRLIAYPQPAFDAVVRAVSGADAPARRARWLCYREAGDAPARPYWLCFVSSDGGGRRFHVGVELFDRDRLGLWFFSGYQADQVPADLLTSFPANPDLHLPRLELTRDPKTWRTAVSWIEGAWTDALTFAQPLAEAPTPTALPVPQANQSHVLDALLLGLNAEAGFELVGLRASRARLLTFAEGRDVEVHPVARLVTTVGRDPHCELVLDDRRVSAEHVRITWRRGEPEIDELGSKNGTVVGGQALTPGRPLHLGAEVPIDLGGLTCLWVRDSEGSLAAQEQRLRDLIARGKLGQADLQTAHDQAGRRGITPAEVLLANRRLSLRDWLGAGGCMSVLLAAVGLALLVYLA